jgi:hypothetical protein
MKVTRQEIRTGVLVVVSLGVLVAVLLFVGAPGVFTPMNTYRIYFDNAAGIRPGAQVLLAGRKVGQVRQIFSPVPAEQRPKQAEGQPEIEALVEVQVERAAQIYKRVNVRMQQNGLLGEMLIDFAGGDSTTGIAADGSYFIGERQKDFGASIAEAVQVVRDVVTPVAKQAEETMLQLRATAGNLQQMTAPGSNIDLAVTKFRELGGNLVDLSDADGPLQMTLGNLQRLTGPESKLSVALENVEKITTELIAQDRINLTLRNFQNASETLDSTVRQIGPQLNAVLRNTEQATDTLKRQPWRLLWPTTKKYNEPVGARPPRLKAERPKRR